MHFYFEEAEKWAEHKESVFGQNNTTGPGSYTHLTLPTTPYV